MHRQEHYPIVKIEIGFFGATPPTGLLVFDTDSIEPKPIDLVEMRYTLMDQSTSRFFVPKILRSAMAPGRAQRQLTKTLDLGQEPRAFLSNKPIGMRLARTRWQSDHHAPIRIDCHSHSASARTFADGIDNFLISERYFFLHR